MANSGPALAIIIFGSEASPIISHFAFCILHLKKPLPRNTGQRPALLTTLITSVLSYAAPVTVGTGEAYCNSALCSGVMFDFCTSYRAYTVPDSLLICCRATVSVNAFHTDAMITRISKYCKCFIIFVFIYIINTLF